MKKMLMIVSLMLVLFLTTGAMAEQAVSDSAESIQVQETETAEASAVPEVENEEQSAVLQALAAYQALKGSAEVKDLDSLKTELAAYVADGKLTSEQADLILQYYIERFASGESDLKQKQATGLMGRNGRRRGHSKGNSESQNGTGRKTKTFDGQGRSNMNGNRKGDSPIDEGTSGNENTEPDSATGATTKGGRQKKR